MPFVNHHEELWQLFRVNADNCHSIATSTETFKSNYRDCQLLFCAQFFGSGKTTLGEVFPDKVKDEKVIKTFTTALDNPARFNARLKSEWAIIQNQGIQRVLIDVGTEPSIRKGAVNAIQAAAIRAAATRDPATANYKFPDTVGHHDPFNSPADAAQHLVKYAADHGPTLFHFDEVCSKQEHDLTELRQLAVAVWKQMHAIAREKGAAAMPRIYFLVTGKSIESFEEVGISGIGSYHLVLDMLKAEHVGAVRSHIMNDQRKDEEGNAKHALRLNNLNKEEDGGYLDECLSLATGGAPRLLLYAFRALEFTKASLATRAEIDVAVKETVFSLLRGINDVAREFLPTSSSPSSRKAFHLLLGFSLQRTRLKLSKAVKLDGKDTTLGQILRGQPFFLSRVGDYGEGGFFVLSLSHYHLMAAKLKFGTDDAALMLLMSMAGGTISANEIWRVFELLPVQMMAIVMASKAAMSQALNRTKMQSWSEALPDLLSWSEALPDLLGNSQVAKIAKFDLGRQPFAEHYEEGQCPAVFERTARNTERYVTSGGSVLPSDKSPSADLFHVQRRTDGKGHVLIEWQAKFKIGSQLTMSTVRAEVGKAAKKLDSVLIIYSTTVGDQLIGAMADGDCKVLTLHSWDSETAAVFAFQDPASKTLLWRPVTTPDDQWYDFPDQTSASATTVNESAMTVEVRPGLDVVIPHHDAVEQLVRPTLFDALVALSLSDGDNSSAVGAVVRTLGEVLNNGKQQPQQQPD
jgi:hypothetical protein